MSSETDSISSLSAGSATGKPRMVPRSNENSGTSRSPASDTGAPSRRKKNHAAPGLRGSRRESRGRRLRRGTASRSDQRGGHARLMLALLRSRGSGPGQGFGGGRGLPIARTTRGQAGPAGRQHRTSADPTRLSRGEPRRGGHVLGSIRRSRRARCGAGKGSWRDHGGRAPPRAARATVGMSAAAVGVFVAVYVLIATERGHRTVGAFGGAAPVLLLR